MQDLWDLFESLVAPVLLAVFGGLARSCRFGVHSFRQFISSAIVSGFTGVVIHLLIQETSLSTSVQAAIVATYRIPLSRERFLSWEADLMTGAGFTNREINAEILRRLGICEK